MSSSTLLELLDPAENAINEMIMLYDALDCPAAWRERVRQFKGGRRWLQDSTALTSLFSSSS